MKLKKMEKVISRDSPLANNYAWYRGYTVGMKKELGWGYSDTVFLIQGNIHDIMRPPEEHAKLFPKFVFNKLNKDKNYLNDLFSKFSELIQETNEFFGKTKKIEKINNDELAVIYNKYVKYVEKVMGPFIIAYYFPNWLEKDKKLLKKYQKEFDISMAARKESEYFFPKGEVLMKNILKIIQEKSDISSDLIYFLSNDELLNYLVNNEKPDISKLEKRKEGVLLSNAGITIIDNRPLPKVFESIGYKYVVEKHEDVKELKGVVACKGSAKGKIRVLYKKNDISSLKNGEILVTAMTTPEFLPAMKKAVAFITDEGGITCHAAIVAREMNKPCIIGTKIATKVLKDGDKVEVDANNGIIKII
ncbi:hypothetical protein GOV14_01680 [Candidatus Pacearchaeota archaeon]|nr:hypothetical protein [Candidatus Pacearchaeota archaeon]